MAEASYRFALVGEDEGHFRVVSALVDAISRETITWLVDQNLDDFREWRADSSPAAPNFTRVSDVKRVGNVVYIDGKPLRLRGFIAGQSLGVESSLWRVALGNLMKQKPSPHLVVFARDLDGKRERRAGMEQVRDYVPLPPDMHLVLATPEPEIEAWMVAGFIPEDDRERANLQALRRELSFDPTTQSARLTSHPNDAKTDAKRVLSRLSGDSRKREERCLADRNRLAERGSDNCCEVFLKDVANAVRFIYSGG